jgi:hypothetical protein
MNGAIRMEWFYSPEYLDGARDGNEVDFVGRHLV